MLEHVGAAAGVRLRAAGPPRARRSGSAPSTPSAGRRSRGARFYYLTGVGAQLQLAMLNLAMSQALAAGFVPVVPPVLVKPEAMEGTGFLGPGGRERLPPARGGPLPRRHLGGAARRVPHGRDPRRRPACRCRYAGWSTCFRREAGSYGKDTRGIIRVHQFDKIEMFSYVDPADAAAEHLRLLAWEKEMLAKVELPYRVIDVAAGDLGGSAARKYDCEAWVPTQGRYRELTSTSNCTTFQARRLRIRLRDGEGTRPLATLNGTLATTRWIVAILENHQQADGSVRRAGGAAPVPRRPRGARAGRDVTDAEAGGGDAAGPSRPPSHPPTSAAELRRRCTRFLQHARRPAALGRAGRGARGPRRRRGRPLRRGRGGRPSWRVRSPRCSASPRRC